LALSAVSSGGTLRESAMRNGAMIARYGRAKGGAAQKGMRWEDISRSLSRNASPNIAFLAQEARNAALNAQSQEAIDMHMAMATAWEHLAFELGHLEDLQPNNEVIAQKRDPLSRTVLRRET